MSRSILRQIQHYGRTYQPIGIITSNIRHYAKDNEGDDNKSNLGHTTILVQQGCDIQELPVILRKIKKDDFVAICTNKIETGKNIYTECDQAGKPEEIIALLDNCVTATGILSIIDQISEKNLDPEVAAHALDRLIRNESLIGLKNLEHNNEVFEKLIQCILKNGDHKMLLDFMELLKTFLDLQKTVRRFCDELLLRNSDGILNIVEICECIERFVDCKQQASAEKFWTGLADNEKNIDDKNVKFIFKILPKLKVSRRLVVGVIDRRMTQLWWNLTPAAATESIAALAQCNSSPFRTLQSFSRWLNTNIHAINETSLETVIRSFTKLDFSNNQVEKALERYIKGKGIKVKTPSLIAAVLNHCVQFRLRNHHILNGCSEYFIANSETVEASNIRDILAPFGYLEFQPLNSIKFWQTIENYLRDNFTKINPRDLIDVFLSCCYLEMYPLNFVSSIFNPYFLDLMHTTTPPEHITKVRSDLKLFDATLALECDNYSGPLLPKDHSAKSIWQDGRIKRIINNISDEIEEIAGGPDNITKSIIIGKLPTNTLYIVDVLIHPSGIGNFWTYSIKNDRNIYVAVLVHLPEYFNSTGEYLIGPQVMRIRHLRKLGLKVVTLEYDKLAKLRVYPQQLKKYLVERVKEALPALPAKDSN